MEKKQAILVTLLFLVLIFGNFLFFHVNEKFDRESVIVTRVIDGDTVELKDGRTVRLANINAPEKRMPNSGLSKEFLQRFQNNSLEMESLGLEKYGRTLGKLYEKDHYLNLELVKERLVHYYIVEDSELGEFRKAQKEAIQSGGGIWKHSNYYGCLHAEINKNDEYVGFIDKCNVNLNGWEVKDESTKSYIFKKDAGERFTLHSGKGTDNETDLYWNKENIWNNDHDAIFVRDDKGLLIYYSDYGY